MNDPWNFYDRLRAYDEMKHYPVSNRSIHRFYPVTWEPDINGHEVIHDISVDCYWFVVPGSGSHYVPITKEEAVEVLKSEGYDL